MFNFITNLFSKSKVKVQKIEGENLSEIICIYKGLDFQNEYEWVNIVDFWSQNHLQKGVLVAQSRDGKVKGYDYEEILWMHLNDQPITYYPFISANTSHLATTKQIQEITYGYGNCAIVKVSCEKFGNAINFFVTDYYKNKRVYKSGESVNMHFVGISNKLIKQSSEIDKLKESHPALKGFYLPIDTAECMYQYYGSVVSIEDKEHGKIYNVAVIDDDKQTFEMPIYLHNKNISETINVGDMVAGHFWCCGYIS